MRILLLGHRGMLGNVVQRFLIGKGITPLTINDRWDSDTFKVKIISADVDYIVNCIGSVPQKNQNPLVFNIVNIDLPVFLETMRIRTIHPSTDCEFSGLIPYPEKYAKNTVRDASDDYGASKARISERIENGFTSTKVIRTSIIGHETGGNKLLMDWFLNSEGTVKGYSNHYWNGITTLFWCELMWEMVNDWENFGRLTQIGTEGISKFELLRLIKDVYGKDINIEPFETDQPTNKMLESDITIPSLDKQLVDLKSFYRI